MRSVIFWDEEFLELWTFVSGTVHVSCAVCQRGSQWKYWWRSNGSAGGKLLLARQSQEHSLTLAIWVKPWSFSWAVRRRCPSKALWGTVWDITARRGADLALTFQGLLYSFLVCFDDILSSWERHTKFRIDAWLWISRKTVSIYLRSLIGLGRHYSDSRF